MVATKQLQLASCWLTTCLARFDGDGMLHACRIKDGKVSYCNRYVATARLARERSLGFPIYMRVRPQLA